MALDGRLILVVPEPVMDLKTILIVVLAVGVAVLGYLYYESQQSAVRVDLPGVKIEAR